MTLPLDTFRQLIGFSPWRFWQWAHDRYAPVQSHCPMVLFEYPWSLRDYVGRSEIREAIQTAEDRLALHLGYPPTPRIISERVAFSAGPIRVSSGKVRAIGKVDDTYVGNANVTRWDADGDGLKERWSITQAVTTTNPGDLSVRFVASDLAYDQVTIAPVRVEINAGIATISGPSWLLARPVLYDLPQPEYFDPTNDDYYAQTLDVYQRTVTDGITYGYAPGVTVPTPLNIGTWYAQDAARGIIAIDYDHCGVTWNECNVRPTHIDITYEAGDDPALWATTITRYALAELARPVCECDRENRAIQEWQWDLAQTSGDVTFQAISQDQLSNPLGTRRGAVYAWQQVLARRLHTGIHL